MPRVAYKLLHVHSNVCKYSHSGPPMQPCKRTKGSRSHEDPSGTPSLTFGSLAFGSLTFGSLTFGSSGSVLGASTMLCPCLLYTSETSTDSKNEAGKLSAGAAWYSISSPFGTLLNHARYSMLPSVPVIGEQVQASNCKPCCCRPFRTLCTICSDST